MTDEQFGIHFDGITPQAVYHARRRLGNPLANAAGGGRHATAMLPEPLTGETYNDASGPTVTRYQARHAEAVAPPVTAMGSGERSRANLFHASLSISHPAHRGR